MNSCNEAPCSVSRRRLSKLHFRSQRAALALYIKKDGVNYFKASAGRKKKKIMWAIWFSQEEILVLWGSAGTASVTACLLNVFLHIFLHDSVGLPITFGLTFGFVKTDPPFSVGGGLTRDKCVNKSCFLFEEGVCVCAVYTYNSRIVKYIKWILSSVGGRCMCFCVCICVCECVHVCFCLCVCGGSVLGEWEWVWVSK